jgi:hypothetical protein
MTCHGTADYVIAGGRLVVDHGEVKVSPGSGKYVEMPPYSPYVYMRVKEREKV